MGLCKAQFPCSVRSTACCSVSSGKAAVIFGRIRRELNSLFQAENRVLGAPNLKVEFAKQLLSLHELRIYFNSSAKRV